MTQQLNRNTTPIRMRNYGRIVQDMISYAAGLPAGSERDSLEVYIAQCMRQRNILWNRDQDSSMARVKEDIIRLSDGQLTCSSELFTQVMQTNAPLQPKKKKK